MYGVLEYVQLISVGRYCNVECTPRVLAPSFQEVSISHEGNMRALYTQV